jgi:hypothetical protein
MTLVELYTAVREKFPVVSRKADDLHMKLWGDPDEESAFVWFESLANALNIEMAAGSDPLHHVPLLNFMDGAFSGGSVELRNCLDVSFMENLFFGVVSSKAKPYWKITPNRLRDLHVAFHGRGP